MHDKKQLLSCFKNPLGEGFIDSQFEWIQPTAEEKAWRPCKQNLFTFAHLGGTDRKWGEL